MTNPRSSWADDLAALYREEFGRVLASVLRSVRDFEIAEESVQDAFVAALARWSGDGWPRSPRAWLIATARHKAIDALRRAGRLERILVELEHQVLGVSSADIDVDLDPSIPDERLRLIFTCCHPSLALEARIALALRTLCGLKTEEIARAFLVPVPTLAQRLVRAKRQISVAGIPYEVPHPSILAERLDAVLAVVYLVFNEGYSASSGDVLLRRDLSHEAIRLGSLLLELMPEAPEVRGLLGLMLLHDARRETRMTPTGELVLLEDQDRSRWDHVKIAMGVALAAQAHAAAPTGPYALQAVIASEHARAPSTDLTDWCAIATHYEALARARPGPVVELNWAIAVAMADGPAAGYALVCQIERRNELSGYYLLYATQADLLRRLGQWSEAARAYRRALALVTTGPERRFLERRLSEVTRAPDVDSR